MVVLGGANSYSTIAPNGHSSGPHDLGLSSTARALRGNNICYVLRKSSYPAFLGVPLLPDYSHANEVPRVAFAPAHLSSPSLVNEPANSTRHGLAHVYPPVRIFSGTTHIFLYILRAGMLSSSTVNDIRPSPSSRKP